MSTSIPDHTKQNYEERVAAGETWADLAAQFRRDNYLDLAEWADEQDGTAPAEVDADVDVEGEPEPEKPAKPAAKA